MFQIFLDAAKKTAKVTALLHCMGEDAIDIYNMEFVPAHGEGDTRVEAENTNDYATVVGKFEAYCKKRDPQLMLREEYWYSLKRQEGQGFEQYLNEG